MFAQKRGPSSGMVGLSTSPFGEVTKTSAVLNELTSSPHSFGELPGLTRRGNDLSATFRVTSSATNAPPSPRIDAPIPIREAGSWLTSVRARNQASAWSGGEARITRAPGLRSYPFSFQTAWLTD